MIGLSCGKLPVTAGWRRECRGSKKLSGSNNKMNKEDDKEQGLYLAGFS
jgi:hypothetical protein